MIKFKFSNHNSLLEVLRKSGIVVAHSFGKSSLKGQMEMADKLKVRYSLILGQKEVQDGTIIIRDMESGIQELFPMDRIVDEIKKRLKK